MSVSPFAISLNVAVSLCSGLGAFKVRVCSSLGFLPWVIAFILKKTAVLQHLPFRCLAPEHNLKHKVLHVRLSLNNLLSQRMTGPGLQLGAREGSRGTGGWRWGQVWALHCHRAEVLQSTHNQVFSSRQCALSWEQLLRVCVWKNRRFKPGLEMGTSSRWGRLRNWIAPPLRRVL